MISSRVDSYSKTSGLIGLGVGAGSGAMLGLLTCFFSHIRMPFGSDPVPLNPYQTIAVVACFGLICGGLGYIAGRGAGYGFDLFADNFNKTARQPQSSEKIPPKIKA